MVLLAWTSAAQEPEAQEPAPRDEAKALEFFEKKVRPLLADHCYNCHSANTNAQGGLRVDDRNGLIAGGRRGPAVVPGRPAQSLLIQAVSHTHEKLKMPPNARLSDEQVADFTMWIEQGAIWPAPLASVDIDEPNAAYDKLRKEHWAWQPLAAAGAGAPDVRDRSWPRDDIDRFILHRLEDEGLAPVADADKPTLLRRVSFDLTGLPPDPAFVEAFVADGSPEAFAKVVDRLLASPAFGERWGRHWLDVARYAESTGSSRNRPFPHAWRYRDYVVDAFNRDKPYDRFLHEQIAGDLLPAESDPAREEHLIATGFLALGVKDVNQRFEVGFRMDNIDEQIDTLSRSVLALTVSCARCHDHKFDPIPTKDYYSLAGIFHSTELCAGVRNKMGGGGLDYYDTSKLLVLDKPPTPAAAAEKAKAVEQAQAALTTARAELKSLAEDPLASAAGEQRERKLAAARQRVNELQRELFAMSDPAAHGGRVALGVREAKTVGDTEIRYRGEAEQLGPLVPRGMLGVLDLAGPPKVNPGQSGRLELAQWLTSENNPLTPRVMVNRVWRHLFGQGLVKSVDNFGVMGDTPSHPELLDHLARRFVAGGWSVKSLVRAIVLSRGYQLSSEAASAPASVDPANRLVWRHSPRRLDAEEIRDATLAVAGRLDLGRAAGSPVRELKVVELSDKGAEAQRLFQQARASRHRGVYLPLARGLTPTELAVFDFVEDGTVTGSRETTTVATQALYLLNDPFVRRQSLALAGRLLARDELDDAGRVAWAVRLTAGRSATALEIERAMSYLADYESAAREAIELANGSEIDLKKASDGSPPQADAKQAVEAAKQAVEAAQQAQAAALRAQAASVQAQAAAVEALHAAQNDQAADQKSLAAAQESLAAARQALAKAQESIVRVRAQSQSAGARVAARTTPDDRPNDDDRPDDAALATRDPRTAAWASFCQALLGMAEFRYVR